MTDDALPGSACELDRFELIAPIREGGMGVLWRAVHRRLHRPVAIKFMRRSLAEDARARARFVREGEAAARVKHPNVVEVFDLDVTRDSTPYIVMELLEGEELRVRLARVGPMPAAVAVDLLLPVCAAVAAAHDAGVAHRDLKPANVFLALTLDRVEVPKVIDFGLSRVRDEAHPPDEGDTPLGTPGYAAPEQVSGAVSVGEHADQYSLGAVLYECVTGHPAFAAASRHALLRRVLEGRFAAPRASAPGLPVPFEQVVLRAMALDPARRFASVRELGGALLPFASERLRSLYQDRFETLGEELAPPPRPAAAREESLAAAVDPETEGETL